MPEPVFSQEDRVQTPVRTENDLPAELRGKSPVEIAQYYQNRETRLRTVAQTAIEQSRTPTTPTTPITPTERPMTGAEVTAARNTMIATAKREASQGKQYWSRLVDQIEAIMRTMAPEYQVDAATWETTYNSLVGANLAKLQAEDATAAAEATRIASERTQAAAQTPPVVEPLPEIVRTKVLPGLERTEAQYRDASTILASTKEQNWPLTFSSKEGRKIIDSHKPPVRSTP